jgi:hypothetical protein
MSRTSIDFYEDFDNLMSSQNIQFLPSLRVRVENETSFLTPDMVLHIVNGARNGDRSQLNKFRLVKNYFVNVLSDFNFKYNDMHNWPFYYREDDEDGDLRFSAEHFSRPILMRLIDDLNKPMKDFFQLITADEIISLRSLARNLPDKKKNRLIPIELEQHMSGFIGKGGISKAKRKGKKKRTTRKLNIGRRRYTRSIKR